jgi:hypothetical protein
LVPERVTVYGLALGQAVPNRLPLHWRRESMRAVACPVVSASVSAATAFHAASPAPGQVVLPLTRMRLTRTRTTAAPAPPRAAPLEGKHRTK